MHIRHRTAPAAIAQGRTLPPAVAASRRDVARGAASVGTLGTHACCPTPHGSTPTTMHEPQYTYYALEHSTCSTHRVMM